MRAAGWVGFGAGAIVGVAAVVLLSGEERATRPRPWSNPPILAPGPEVGPPELLDGGNRSELLPPASGRARAWLVR